MTRRRLLKLTAPGVLPRSANTLPYCFGAPLREAAAPLRAAFLERLPADSPLRDASSLEATARVAFADRRRRAAHNFEAVLLCALHGALEDAGWRERNVNLTVRLRSGAARPGTTIELGGSR